MNSVNKAQSQLLCSTAELKSFLLAGRAVVTLKSLKTQEHFTFKIQLDGSTSSTPPSRRWHVKVLSYAGNYQSIGQIYESQEMNFARPAKMTAGPHSPSFRAFKWFWVGVRGGQEVPRHLLEVYHEGRCGRCGRPLTHPESIKSGIGPECKQLMEGARALEEF